MLPEVLITGKKDGVFKIQLKVSFEVVLSYYIVFGHTVKLQKMKQFYNPKI